MTNTTETNTETNNETTGSGSFPETYMRLRTVLDALEMNALRYCLSETREAAKIRKAEEIEALLMPVLEKVNGRAAGSGGGPGCDPGYHNCGGICVPYPCP